ncbi:hypothetical protein ES703_98247 [subsurface metagenome]
MLLNSEHQVELWCLIGGQNAHAEITPGNVVLTAEVIQLHAPSFFEQPPFYVGAQLFPELAVQLVLGLLKMFFNVQSKEEVLLLQKEAGYFIFVGIHGLSSFRHFGLFQGIEERSLVSGLH